MLSGLMHLIHGGIFWIRNRITSRQFLLLSSVFVGISAALAVILLKTFAHQVYLFASDLNQRLHFQYVNFILPVIGIVLTVFIVKRVLKGNLEKGTWRIIYAITKRSSILPRAQMYAQIITSSITVGFGGSAGLESPVTITGAAFGSNYARQYRLSAKERTLLLACGVAAGIAAAFNAPIAGVLFTMEVLLADVGISAFIPLMLSAATGALVSTVILNDKILLSLKGQLDFDYFNILWYILLGILTGFIAVYHSRMFVRIEGYFERLHWGKYRKAIIGALLLSVMILLFPCLFGEGYESVKVLSTLHPENLLNDTFFSNIPQQEVLLLLFVGVVVFLKAIATGITLGSGGNGGNFAPSLFVGSYTGFAFAYGLNLTGWFDKIPVTNFTMVGMAGMLSGLFHAPLTAMFLIAEITGGYNLMIPLMIVSSISFAISKRFVPHSMDTQKLAEDGHVMRADKDRHVLSTIDQQAVLEEMVVVLNPDDTIDTLFRTVRTTRQALFPIVNDRGSLLGMIYLNDLPDLLHIHATDPNTPLESFMEPIIFYAGPDDPMEKIMDLFDQSGLSYLPLIYQDQVLGYYSKTRLLDAYRKKVVESIVE
ncbi:MAG: transporter [Candidatus Fluviicola riflensis]|nr:MAG: chloride channel protein [Candidatus Fluviicola riflensis]OGS78869.1 MAG: transporter [Candidatus Fluviicola riflensis]OGS85891.1 MAG: transporter [Fluviicola sp. RIFCSPHIGHO2_12_FULL_43_24]OGS86300.1 MAG: transporter [Fluviicola sp. RIFCSPHIGHO2_01_FULL_43_53]